MRSRATRWWWPTVQYIAVKLGLKPFKEKYPLNKYCLNDFYCHVPVVQTSPNMTTPFIIAWQWHTEIYVRRPINQSPLVISIVMHYSISIHCHGRTNQPSYQTQSMTVFADVAQTRKNAFAYYYRHHHTHTQWQYKLSGVLNIFN